MQKFLTIAAAVLFVFGSIVSAQTAGGGLPKPPENTVQNGFSESVEYKPRNVSDERRDKPKKEKKKKKDAPAQAAQPANESKAGSETEIKSELITVPVSVFDRSGKFVRNLKSSDFEIYFDGKRQEISGFQTKDEPVSVVLMIDVSPSTAYNIEDIQNYALTLVEQLQPQDKVLVVEFSEATRILAELTDDRKAIYKAIRSAKFGDGTSLYGAVKSTFEKRISSIQGRKAVILLTDGVDTTSRSADYKSSLLAAEISDAPVFPVYLNTFNTNSKSRHSGNNTIHSDILNQNSGTLRIPGIPSSAGLLKEEYELGRNYLDDIALLSGGRPLAIQKSKGKEKIAVENVGAEIRLQYLVSFNSSEAEKIDGRKSIKVRVNRPDLFVQARGSYIVGSNKR